MDLTYKDVFEEFLKFYPALKGRVRRWEPCTRPVNLAIYIWIDDNQKYYYSYGVKRLQPMYI